MARICFAVFLLAFAISMVDGKEKPNILFILTDDQGWPTLSCYGNEHVETPHLDRLAAKDLLFQPRHSVTAHRPG
ncbi:MAG: sulfatase-like hydrolase/transferase, partial [Verrucomicrobiales bacterium]|nr:sulfatase-like hydrolase/transferase [Verrucomicrobiales bacterium]